MRFPSVELVVARLCVRCIPETEETLQGFMLRIAAANGYPRLSWLLQVARLPRAFASDACDLGPLARMLGQPADDLNGLATWPVTGSTGRVTFGSTYASKGLVSLGRKRICTDCVRGRHIIRRLWLLQPVVACPEHGTLLIDRCPDCGTDLQFYDLPVEGCPCGWGAHTAASGAAAMSLVQVARMLATLAEGRTTDAGAAPVRSLDGALRLVWLASTTSAGESWRSDHMSKPDVATLAPMIEKAAPILLDWPAGFHRWMSGHGRTGDGRVGVRAEFGPWLGRLTQVLRVEGCEEVADEARSWLAARWGRGLLKPSSFLASSGHPFGRLTAREAASRLGIRAASVGRMIDAGEIEAEVRAMGRRTLRRVDPASVDRVLAAVAGTLDAEGAAARLGGTVRAVDAMRTIGLLPAAKILVDGRRSRRYAIGDVDAAAERLLAIALPLDDVDHCVRLSELPARKQVSLGRVIGAITTGAARCWRGGMDGEPVFHRIRVRLPEVAGASPSVTGKLSVREAAKALGLSTRMIPALVAAGCLRASPASGVRHRAIAKRGIDAASVASFGSRYALSRDIAAVHGTSIKDVIARLRAAGAEPLVESDSRAGISAVWRVSDAVELPRQGAKLKT